MPTQSSSPMRAVPQRQDGGGFVPRPGQQALIDRLAADPSAALLTVRWPTGYGKSKGIALAYKAKREAGLCDRLLIVVANTTQARQTVEDFKTDCRDVGLVVKDPWLFNKEPVTYRAHVEGRAEVFVTTIQMVSATARGDIDTLTNLLRSGGRWMLAADEYHHYADERDWGTSLARVRDLSVFTLAMSATPDRDDVPTIFGKPTLVKPYLEAVQEEAVKRFTRHAYNYAVDVKTPDGEVVRFTTDELREIEQAEGFEKFEQRRKLRYTPKYVSPILLHPVTRLIDRRLATGQPLQLLVRAMSCLHAEYIAEQMASLFGDELRVDWVGTGMNGRTDEQNTRTLAAFCPRKTATGARGVPTVDVLVQVGMAGEGLDTVYVAEIIDLSLASLKGAANQSKQFLGRGARWVPALAADEQICHVSVPSDHPLAGVPVQMTAWFDGAVEMVDAEAAGQDQAPREYEFAPMPPEPPSIEDVTLMNVTSDDPHYVSFVRQMNAEAERRGRRAWDLDDPVDVESSKAFYLKVYHEVEGGRRVQAENEMRREQLDRHVKQYVRKAFQKLNGRGAFAERSAMGDMIRRMNGHLKAQFGERSAAMPEDINRMWRYVATLDERLSAGEPVPLWLA